MPEEVTLEGRVRSRSQSQGSDAQRNATKQRKRGSGGGAELVADAAADKTTTNGSNEPGNNEKKRKKKRQPHPAQQKKAVLLSLAENVPDGEAKARRGSMFRRFSRAASFKKAREHLPVDIDLKGIMRRFERHSTIHGICHAALAPNKRWRRFWLSVFLVCLVILIIQVIYLAIKFLHYPKTVDLDLKFENAPFPSVTICNLNPYKASAIRNDKAAKATMDALENVLQETGRTEGGAAAIITNSAKVRRELSRKRQKDEIGGGVTASKDWRDVALAIHRRYLQVYATCYCEINRLSAVRKRGSCYAAYKNRVTLRFLQNQTGDEFAHYFYPTKCLCQLDWAAKAIWPCFPYNTWKEHICMECVDSHGHCPMRFLNYRREQHQNWNKTKRRSGIYGIETLDEHMDVCICHREYNHCVANNFDGDIPEILPGDDLEMLNITHLTNAINE